MGSTRKGEYYRTSEMLVEIAEKQGVYYAVALLVDSGYNNEHLQKLLPLLQQTQGSIK